MKYPDSNTPSPLTVEKVLRALPARPAPARLTGELLVMASREAARRRSRTSVATFARHLASRASLLMENMMKPFLVPVTGGVLSAFVLFSMIAPTLTILPVQAGDVPTGLSTHATLESSLSFHFDGDIVVDVEIDEQGRVADYSIPRGQAWASDPAKLRSVENTLLCTRFTPATVFGVPASERTRISMRSSRVEVNESTD